MEKKKSQMQMDYDNQLMGEISPGDQGPGLLSCSASTGGQAGRRVEEQKNQGFPPRSAEDGRVLINRTDHSKQHLQQLCPSL